MRYSILILFLAFIIYPAYTQAQNDQPGNIQNFTNPSATIQTTTNEEYKGSPYYNEDWETGYVIFNSDSSKKVQLKYSSYTNELLFKKNGQTLAVLPRTFKGFVLLLDDEKVLFKKGYNANHDISTNSLLRVIYEGDTKLLAKHTTNLRKANRADPLTGKRINRFLSNVDYFLVDSKGKFHKVKLKDNHILEALASHENELEQYADNNDLDWDEESDLKKILAEYEKMTDAKK